MLKITGIDKDKLLAAGFTETENGLERVIPDTERFTYTLYITPSDIYGTLTQTAGFKTLDYEEWLDHLSFRDKEPAAKVRGLIAELQASGAITAAEVQQ